MEKQRGKFIVLDAISGAGKGKQIELLKKKLSDCYFDFEPSDELYGEVIHSIIERRGCREETLERCLSFGNPENEFWIRIYGIIRKMMAGLLPTEKEIQMLYMADRVYGLETKYLPKLEKGINVILDRYFFSTLAYGFSGGLDMDVLWNWQMKAFASSKMILDNWKPDLLIIFDLDAKTAMKRLKLSGKIIDIFEEKLERLNKIRDGYKILAGRSDLSKKITVIDASRSINEIHEDVLSEIKLILNQKPL
ncbi:MAG: dTMP kinase [Patescibacteria group bacterium]